MRARTLRGLFASKEQHKSRKRRQRRLQRHTSLQMLEERHLMSGARISISDATVLEQDASAVDAVFSLSLSEAAATPVTVQYMTKGVTATAGSDFVPAAGEDDHRRRERNRRRTALDVHLHPGRGVAHEHHRRGGARLGTGRRAGAHPRLGPLEQPLVADRTPQHPGRPRTGVRHGRGR